MIDTEENHQQLPCDRAFEPTCSLFDEKSPKHGAEKSLETLRGLIANIGNKDTRQTGWRVLNTYLQMNDLYSYLPHVVSTSDELGLSTLCTPCVIAIGGHSGSGKTYMAHQLADRGMIHLSSDILRKSLSPSSAHEVDSPYDAGIYAKEKRAYIYEQLFVRISPIIKAGFPVVLDATFLDPETRLGIETLAQVLEVPFFGAWCRAPRTKMEDQILLRSANQTDASEAGVHVLYQQLKTEIGIVYWKNIEMVDPLEIRLRTIELSLPSKIREYLFP